MELVDNGFRLCVLRGDILLALDGDRFQGSAFGLCQTGAKAHELAQVGAILTLLLGRVSHLFEHRDVVKNPVIEIGSM